MFPNQTKVLRCEVCDICVYGKDSTTCPDVSVLEQTVPEQSVPEQHVLEHVPDHIESHSSIEQISEPNVLITSEVSDMEVEISNSSSTSVPDQLLETNIQTVIPTNDQPSSSNLAIQACTPPRTTKVPSPPTLFLDSSILEDVCENIFQELNKLVQARNNLVYEDNYVKQWRRLREKVDFIISELERSSLDAQGTA